jgi:hypothetical protein
MKCHERNELLHCARETATALSLPPANVPIEGYYTEDAMLTEYFRLVRSLQTVGKSRESELAGVQGFKIPYLEDLDPILWGARRVASWM